MKSECVLKKHADFATRKQEIQRFVFSLVSSSND